MTDLDPVLGAAELSDDVAIALDDAGPVGVEVDEAVAQRVVTSGHRVDIGIAVVGVGTALAVLRAVVGAAKQPVREIAAEENVIAAITTQLVIKVGALEYLDVGKGVADSLIETDGILLQIHDNSACSVLVGGRVDTIATERPVPPPRPFNVSFPF